MDFKLGPIEGKLIKFPYSGRGILFSIRNNEAFDILHDILDEFWDCKQTVSNNIVEFSQNNALRIHSCIHLMFVDSNDNYLGANNF